MTGRYFEVTPDKNSIDLDEKGQGEFTFTVRNVSGRAMRGSARVLPKEKKEASWFSILGEEILEFENDATHEFKVRIAAPPGAMEGAHSFRLGVYNVANMAEEYGESEQVNAVVPRKEKPDPRPIWPWVAGAAAVILIAVILFFVIPRGATIDFGARVTSGAVDLEVVFDNNSEGVGEDAKWLWTFGDEETSTEPRPVHTYKKVGEFDVTLQVNPPDGKKTTKERFIVAKEALKAAFTSAPVLDDPTPFTVQFTDTSRGGPVSWSWTFPGSEEPVAEQNPKHAFDGPGTYPVKLTVTNVDGQGDDITQQVKVLDRLKAEFGASALRITKGASVTFTDLSTGEPDSWEWKFGEQGTSAKQNPTHKFDQIGTFAVSLRVKKGAQSDRMEKQKYIEVSRPNVKPKADFTATLTVAKRRASAMRGARVDVGRAEMRPLLAVRPVSSIRVHSGQTVYFQDRSTGDVNKWSWDFGDKTPKSTAKNPGHTYAKAGDYNVTLTASGPAGSDTMTRKGFVRVAKRTKPDTVRPQTLGPFKPVRVRGDDEFDGHGPDVTASVSLVISRDRRSLQARVFMRARETKKNWSEALPPKPGYWEKTIYTAPRGWVIQSLLTRPPSVTDQYRDTSHAARTRKFAWCTIVTVGDSKGKDIGRTTSVKATIHQDRVRVLLVEQ